MARRAQERAREGRSTRDVILDVGERRFAEGGFTGVSMRDIAAEAGLRNQASLYNHFANKQALYEAVLSRGLEGILAIMLESRAASAEAVEPFVERTFAYLAEHPELPKLIQRAALDDSRRLRSIVTRHMRPVFAEGLTALASAGMRRRSEELPYLALGLYHLIFGYFANVQLLEIVGQKDPLGAQALAQQRRFVKAAVTKLLDAAGSPSSRRRLRLAR